MIIIKGADAVIEIDITNILDDRSYYSSIECNVYYKNNDILFTSKNIEICYFELEELYLNLKSLKNNTIKSYPFTCDRKIISITFIRDRYGSDIMLDIKFYLEWESDSCFQSKLLISEEQLQCLIQDIHYLMLIFKEK